MTFPPKSRTLQLGFIIAVSLAAHLWGIASPLLDYHYHRQCNTAAIARNYHENGLHFFTPQIDWEGPYDGLAATEFPVYMWLMGLLWPLWSLGHLWGRLLSALFSAGTAVYLFKFLEKRFSTDASFYAAILFSLIPLEIYFGRTVQPEAIALLGAVASLYHWEKSLAPPRSALQWSLALFWAFLSLSQKLPYIHILIPLAALSLLTLKHKAWTDPRTLSAPVIVLAAVYAWYRHAGSGTYVVPSHPGEFLIMLEYDRLPYFVFFQFLSRYPELTATYGGLVLMGFGLRDLRRRQDRFFAIWWSSVAGLLIAGGGYTFRHEYTSLPFVPINAALMGLGLSFLRHKAANSLNPLARPVLILLVLSIPVHAGLRIKHWYGITHPFLVHAQKAADAVSAPDDLFIGNERGASVFLYHLHRKGWSWDLSEQGLERLNWIDEKIKLGARFYATGKDSAFSEPAGPFHKYFRRFPVVYDQDGILIYRLTPALSR